MRSAIQKCAHRLVHSYPSRNDQNQLSILIINFRILSNKLALSVVIYAIVAFFSTSSRAQDLEGIQKNETA